GGGLVVLSVPSHAVQRGVSGFGKGVVDRTGGGGRECLVQVDPALAGDRQAGDGLGTAEQTVDELAVVVLGVVRGEQGHGPGDLGGGHGGAAQGLVAGGAVDPGGEDVFAGSGEVDGGRSVVGKP